MAEGKKAYHGRLAFDPDSGFHTDNDGVAVVTHDEGKSWYYAEDGDVSHIERHHKQFAVVDGTQQQLIELQLEHGRTEGERLMRELHPHHYDPSPDDAHYSAGAKSELGVVHNTRIKFTPDVQAVKETGHTDAWSK